MNRKAILFFFFASVASAMVLSVVSFFCLRGLNEGATYSYRQSFAFSLAREFESRPFDEAIERYGRSHQSSSGGMRNKIWVVEGEGRVVTANTVDPLPLPWSQIERPEAIHGLTVQFSNLFALNPNLTTVRLDKPSSTYLIFQSRGRTASTFVLMAPVGLTFVVVALSLFLSLSLTFLYLQKKSREAKDVLVRMGKGDLKARFKIKRIDQFGNLMLDFNRMAAEIERLVGRVRETESSRRNLLLELGHDLRTPLTGLKTSVDTLRGHFHRMPPEDQRELMDLIEDELNYFIRLIEDLFFIAGLDEPHYKQNTGRVDLFEILGNEMKLRQAKPVCGVQWVFVKPPGTRRRAEILGDSHLISRLFKNSFDNAEKHAANCVNVRTFDREVEWEIEIVNDGTAISNENITNFGQRRRNRMQSSGPQSQFSLGLGSVIMSSIVALHHGRLEVEGLQPGVRGAQFAGTSLRFFLPKLAEF